MCAATYARLVANGKGTQLKNRDGYRQAYGSSRTRLHKRTLAPGRSLRQCSFSLSTSKLREYSLVGLTPAAFWESGKSLRGCLCTRSIMRAYTQKNSGPASGQAAYHWRAALGGGPAMLPSSAVRACLGGSVEYGTRKNTDKLWTNGLTRQGRIRRQQNRGMYGVLHGETPAAFLARTVRAHLPR